LARFLINVCVKKCEEVWKLSKTIRRLNETPELTEVKNHEVSFKISKFQSRVNIASLGLYKSV